MLTLVTGANDLTVLTVAERRRAANVLTGAQDEALADLDLRASTIIAGACGVARAGVATPTLKSEVVRETIRLSRPTCTVTLKRRFVSAVASVTVDGAALTGSDYEIDGPPGFLHRLSSDALASWELAKVVVEYTAGFTTIPPDIKMAVAKVLGNLYAESTRDPTIKRERVEGVGDFEYWAGSASDATVPNEVMQIIKPYRSMVAG